MLAKRGLPVQLEQSGHLVRQEAMVEGVPMASSEPLVPLASKAQLVLQAAREVLGGWGALGPLGSRACRAAKVLRAWGPPVRRASKVQLAA